MEVERKNVNCGAIREANLPIIWVLGGPGSGKGTQCMSLVAKLGFTHLSSGDLLRNEVLSESKIGRQLYNLMERGELVPMTVVLDLLAEAMVNDIHGGKNKGFLLDAFPINLEQAEAFESYVTSPTKVLYLSTEQDVMIDRLLERGNFDDNKESIEKRCSTFQTQTRPVLEKYAAKLVKVNADRPSEEVAQDMAAGIGLL
eukprot:GFUD01023561.1.p1 GENE.GFUD01023561.1~~GFUD01023561.1.p1  ORF type:complete len:200 (+),score=50.47 GFUD01023561.1:131-730(+)